MRESPRQCICGKTSGVKLLKLYTGIFVVAVCVRIVHAAAAAVALRFQPLFSTVFSRCTQRKVRLTIILRNYIYFLRGFSLLALFLKLNNF